VSSRPSWPWKRCQGPSDDPSCHKDFKGGKGAERSVFHNGTQIYAVDAWLAKRAGISREQLGWDVSLGEGWANVWKRIPGKPYKREVAILAASMPAQHIDFYNPEGTKQIGYPDYQKLNIPASVIAYVRKQFEKNHIFQDLYQSSRTVGRRVSAWEDGPGHKHFHGSSRA